MSIDEIITQIKPMNTKLVEITGGEPMLQSNTVPLMKKLLKKNYNVLLETSGAVSLADVPKEVK